MVQIAARGGPSNLTESRLGNGKHRTRNRDRLASSTFGLRGRYSDKHARISAPITQFARVTGKVILGPVLSVYLTLLGSSPVTLNRARVIRTALYVY